MVEDSRGRKVESDPRTAPAGRGKNHLFLKASRGEALTSAELATLSDRTQRRVQQGLEAARKAERCRGKRLSLHQRAAMLTLYLIDDGFTGDFDDVIEAVRQMKDG